MFICTIASACLRCKGKRIPVGELHPPRGPLAKQLQ